MISNLLDNCEQLCPTLNMTKGQANFIIRLDDNDLNSLHVVKLQKYLSYIIKFYNEKSNSSLKFMVRIQIKTNFFRDKSVVLFIESLLYSLLYKRKIHLYFHIQRLEKNRLEYSFFEYSYLHHIVQKHIDSDTYCSGFKKNYMELQYLRYFVDSKDNVSPDFISRVGTDISSTLKRELIPSVTIGEISNMVEELVDNILTHTNGEGIIELSYELLKKGNDQSKKYYQFVVNVINFSDIYLYTGLRDGFLEGSLEEETNKIIETAYLNQYNNFHDDDYSEDLFFMVSTFQNGTTTRHQRGGTGLNKIIKDLVGKSESMGEYYTAYVYSGKNVLKFNSDILNNKNIGDNIAFNKYNNYMMRPDKSCLSSSAFEFKGTAYDLMFVVKEDNL